MPDATAFARQWADGSDGTVRGLDALREYWSAGLAAHPDLRHEVLDVFEGLAT